MTRQEWRWCLGWGSVVMAVTLLPFLIVMTWAPEGATFSGFMWNPDDHCVYLAWMEQARQGHFFMRNLFTGDAQRGVYTNLYFWGLGVLARVLHLPSPTVFHGARLVFGVATLSLAYRLHAFFTTDLLFRRLGFWLVAVSAGLGWIPYFWNQNTAGPVDVWQPEAITFASLYTNGLFCVSLTLMLGVVCLLLAAERGRDLRLAAGAGALGFLLANVHSYDVITLTAVWAGYLLVRGIAGRRVPKQEIAVAGVAALVALPAVAYQLYFYLVEPVFQKRVAVPTTSPAFWRYLVGYGLLLPLAVVGVTRLLSRPPTAAHPREAWVPGPPSAGSSWLLPVWAVIGFGVPYLPVSFQRKMVMGLHIPLALLAAHGLAKLVAWCSPLGASGVRELAPAFEGGSLLPPPRDVDAADDLARRLQAAARESGSKPPHFRERWRRLAPTLLLAGIVALTSISNVRYLVRDLLNAMKHESSTGMHPIFWSDTEYSALRWLKRSVTERSVVLSSPIVGSMIPAVAGRAVYAGHWGETPEFKLRFNEAYLFFRLDWPSRQRLDFLRARRITHVYVGELERRIRQLNDPRFAPATSPLDLSREPYLTRVYPPPGAPEPGPDGVVIYEVKPSAAP